MRLLKQFGAIALVSIAGNALVNAMGWNPPLTLIAGLATSVMLLLAYRWVVRKTEGQLPADLALPGAAASVRRGLLIGAGMFSSVIAIIALLGGYEVVGWGSLTGAVAVFGFTAGAVVSEELLFRGILFRIIEGRVGTWAALVLTMLVFGLAHGFNPGATAWSTISVAVAAGGTLAAAYAATRTLWLPIGLHFAWNFVQGGVFGNAISGKTAPDGLLRGVTSGPTILSGGEFGPEASVFTVVIGLAVTFAFMRLARRRGLVLPRRRRIAAPTELTP
ncbi:lysostaphin resistance A-like protein [Lentzea sp. E54]|uniref:CPBP family intramembrane glutamic endopeptidase n=1 Tax=Lentzea xerophila TaxID=3435883 RepID=UPI003DA53997